MQLVAEVERELEVLVGERVGAGRQLDGRERAGARAAAASSAALIVPRGTGSARMERQLPGGGQRGVGSGHVGVGEPRARPARRRGPLAAARRWRIAPLRSTSRAPAVELGAAARAARRRAPAVEQRPRRSRSGVRSPVSRSASGPPRPRGRRPAVLLDSPGGRVSSGSPASWRAASRRRARGRPRRPRPPRRPSPARRARAPRASRSRGADAAPTTSARGSGTARRRRPSPAPRRTRPSSDRGRHALPREQVGDQRADRGKPGVAPVVEGRVGGERGELRQVRAQGVVDGERAVGAADRDVDL